MDQPIKNFRTCVLTSGLVTPAELDQTIVALWTERSGGGTAQVEIADQELAEKLVELGKLTQYQATQLLAGRTKLHLMQYRILDSIGRGGMGQVFKAQHTFMDRIVAIKVLPSVKANDEATKSFMHEIRTQAKLHHENLVQAFDAGYDSVYFLVTEYVPGTDLRKYVRQCGQLSMHEAATIVSQAAAGLAHAHSQGLIHRDVKPGNLLVTPQGRTKVSDLGLAGWVNGEELDPKAGKIVGTADYLAPEQIISPREVTQTADIYALGCTLYYAVTGKVPFPGGTMNDKARRHLEDMPLHPRRLNADLSDQFVDVIAEMMDKDVRRRIQTADEVVRRLAQWAGDRITSPITDTREWLTSIPEGTPSFPETEGSEAFAPLPENDWQSEEFGSQSSHFSQGTDVLAQADQDTAPSEKFETWLKPKRKMSREVMLLGIVAGLAIITLLVVLISAILK